MHHFCNFIYTLDIKIWQRGGKCMVYIHRRWYQRKRTGSEYALASVFSIIRNCSVPFGITSEQESNISSTRWRSVSDQKNLVYYFETVLSPCVFCIDLNAIDFDANTKPKELKVGNDGKYVGISIDLFAESKPFEFAGLE